jgi:ATP-binding cassette, subfamily B, bacterial
VPAAAKRMFGASGLGLMEDEPVTRQQIKPGVVKRIFPYAKPYRWTLVILLSVTAVDAAITALNPLLFGVLIDDGILPGRIVVVVGLAASVAGLALIDAVANFIQIRSSSRIGQGVIYDLRNQVFEHVQKQPLAFFTRSQTGSLVSRLNTDVVGAQQAISTLLSQTVDTLLTLALVIAAMFYLSWQISIMALVLIPLFVFPGKIIGRILQRLTRETMQLNAEMGSMMNERFNVAGAMLSKLFGRPDEESGMFRNKAGRVRDIGVRSTTVGRALGIIMSLLSTLTLALTFGVGGALTVHHVIKIGTLVALITLIGRLYGPINNLSNMQANVLTALVSFDRVFEVLDLKPLVSEQPGALALSASASGNGGAPDIQFDQVTFRYPTASEVSLASLESIALPVPERLDNATILNGISFLAPGGKLTALVGPSGAGKTTITHLVPRFYDPGTGTVRIGGHDIRDVTLKSLHATVGVVTQDAHMFHDTIRSNLLYARPGATERELIEACEAARIWDLIASLSNGLDTVVGDRGYRLSGGEKQRIALARLLLKAPPVVVLDEATAHLDSESEVAIQRALKTALAGRTSLVIAHRLSTIREADQILVIDAGQIVQRGTHDELLAAGGLYADLYRTQFARQKTTAPEHEDRAAPEDDGPLWPAGPPVPGAPIPPGAPAAPPGPGGPGGIGGVGPGRAGASRPVGRYGTLG